MESSFESLISEPASAPIQFHAGFDAGYTRFFFLYFYIRIHIRMRNIFWIFDSLISLEKTDTFINKIYLFHVI